MKIKTEILQNLVNKAIKGVSNNAMIPLTSLMGIEVNKDLITLMATDGSNQLRVSSKIEQDVLSVSNNFYTIINADIFSKLVGKTTKEYIELNNNDKYLEVTGNGSYKLEIAINAEGDMVKFPDIPNISELSDKSISLNLSLLQESIKVAKASVAKTMEIPCLTGYYIGETLITTNRDMACKLEDCGIKGADPILISNEMAELILIIDNEPNIKLVIDNNNLIFYTSNFVVVGKELEGKELYPVGPIENLTSQEYANIIKVDKQSLLNILDRMSLFVTDYDKNGIYLNFGKNQLSIRSQKSNAEEIIEYKDTQTENEFECLVDIEMLKAQIEPISTPEVEIQYGQDKSIKIVDGKCSLIVSLVEKPN